MNALLRELGRLTIFMVCAQLIVCFRPKESYEKYLKLLMTGVILLQFFRPVQRLLSMETTDLEGALWEFQERFYEQEGEDWIQEEAGAWHENGLPKGAWDENGLPKWIWDENSLPKEEWDEDGLPKEERDGNGVEITPVEEVTIDEIMVGGDDES